MTRAHEIVHRLGHRGSFLLFLAFLDAVYSWYLFFPPAGIERAPSIKYMTQILPLGAWGTTWGAVGAVCLVQAFMRRDMVAFALAAMLKLLWGVINLGAWLAGDAPQGYLAGAVWMAFAASVLVVSDWSEPMHSDEGV